MNCIRNIADLRLCMQRNKITPYFISPTPFNLLGIDEWVDNFKYINSIDCFDGRHPNVFVPQGPLAKFESIKETNSHLLQNKRVMDYIAGRDGTPASIYLMSGEAIEATCKELGIENWSADAKLRERCDNKIETVRIGNKAGVPSVPNTLAPARTYEELLSSARKAGLGDDLVVQTAYGDSGRTTFFIANEDDYNRYAPQISAEDEVKIMKRINCRSATMDACVTASGTIAGPLLTEVIGKPELTPYKGGWCGNEIFQNAFPPEIRAKARDIACRWGNQALKEGFRGYFNLDILIDYENNKVYLGEINPRISGASLLTNHAAFAHGAVPPLFVYHMMEFCGVGDKINVDELNDRWERMESIEPWSHLMVKSITDIEEIVTDAPATGVYRMASDGSVSYNRFTYQLRQIESEDEAFFLRTIGPGDNRYLGADLGILIMRGRVMDDDFELNKRAINWTKDINRQFVSKPNT
ncbi:biotin carboxylase [Rhizobium leguminosarum]|uniref:biotin carboxylase n=1 Tax=Rhizobium leguminosarum TaxID=384 RepID=UPI001AE57638|nr:biotin carboxylase [Rhizobium leguminosarum]MBP2444198.1 hypothetical protein [Rhizobium leguminosarum]